MKNRILSRYLSRRLFGMTLAVAFTCAVAGQEKKSVTVDLAQIKKSLADLQARIGDTTSALDALKQAAKSKSDLKSAHGTFDRQFKQLETQVELLRSQGTAIRTRADDHYKAWQTELTKMGNAKLREKAQNRFNEAKEEFDEIIVIADEAKRELAPFMADLKDVSSYLSADLSADAVKSLNNTIWKLGNKSRSVNASIQHVTTQINKALEVQPEGK